MDSLGQRIKRARERARMTQRQLAQVVGVDPKTVDNWENGRTTPRSSLGALEQVLNQHGFTPGEVPPEPPAGDRAAVKQIRMILESELAAGLTAETKLAMIKDVINRDHIPDEDEEQAIQRRAASG